MSEQKHEETRDLSSVLRSLLGEAPHQEQQTPQGVLTGIDISKLLEYILNDKPRAQITEESFARVKEILQLMETESRNLIDVFINDGMSRIVHPLYGDTLILARLGEVAVLLRQIIRKEWAAAKQMLINGAPPEDTLNQLRRAEYLTKLSYLILVSVADKLMALFFLNAPARARPPLANVAIGYDLIK